MELADGVRQKVDADAEQAELARPLRTPRPRTDLVQAEGGGQPADARADDDDRGAWDSHSQHLVDVDGHDGLVAPSGRHRQDSLSQDRRGRGRQAHVGPEVVLVRVDRLPAGDALGHPTLALRSPGERTSIVSPSSVIERVVRVDLERAVRPDLLPVDAALGRVPPRPSRPRRSRPRRGRNGAHRRGRRGSTSIANRQEFAHRMGRMPDASFAVAPSGRRRPWPTQLPEQEAGRRRWPAGRSR